MKKFVSILISVTILVGMFTSLSVFAFNDIDNPYIHIYYEEIGYWRDKGVVEGDGAGNFEPLRAPTRAELVKTTVLASGITEIEGAPEPNYSDVEEDDWFYPYVRIAYQNGLIEDSESGLFEPDREIRDFREADDMCMRAFLKPSQARYDDGMTRNGLIHVLTQFENETRTLIRVDGSIDESQPRRSLYKTVSEAIAAAPTAESEAYGAVIYIAPGTYRERVLIDKPYIEMEKDPEYVYTTDEVKLTYYYGASRNYKSYDALTPEMEYPSEDEFADPEEYAAAVEEYESAKTLLDGKPYVKSDGYISGVGTQNSASVTVTEAARGFRAKNITFENSYNVYMTEEEKSDIYEPESEDDVALSENLDEKNRNVAWYESAAARRVDAAVGENKSAQTQAVALRCSADRSYFEDCSFIGRQDTLYIKDKARCYFLDCYVEGTVDFIFGDANAVFNHCEIRSRAYPNGGYITAGSHSENQSRGYLFYCCKLTGDEELSLLDNASKVKLGRPWRENALVVYYKCYMGDHIATGEDRFADMSGNSRENARFMEMSSRDLDGNYLGAEVYASYEYTEDCRYRFINVDEYVSAGYDKLNDRMAEPDNWTPLATLFEVTLFEYYDDGEIVDGVPVWYDGNNMYHIPEI